MAVQKLFQVDIGVDDETQEYIGQVAIIPEQRGFVYRETSLGKLLPRLKKLLLQKNSLIRTFPLRPQSMIIAPDGKGIAQLVTPAHN